MHRTGTPLGPDHEPDHDREQDSSSPNDIKNVETKDYDYDSDKDEKPKPKKDEKSKSGRYKDEEFESEKDDKPRSWTLKGENEAFKKYHDDDGPKTQQSESDYSDDESIPDSFVPKPKFRRSSSPDIEKDKNRRPLSPNVAVEVRVPEEFPEKKQKTPEKNPESKSSSSTKPTETSCSNFPSSLPPRSSDHDHPSSSSSSDASTAPPTTTNTSPPLTPRNTSDASTSTADDAASSSTPARPYSRSAVSSQTETFLNDLANFWEMVMAFIWASLIPYVCYLWGFLMDSRKAGEVEDGEVAGLKGKGGGEVAGKEGKEGDKKKRGF